MAFARHGALLALTLTPKTVQLVNPATSRELATLTAPDLHVLSSLCFSRDGSQLAATTYDHVVQLWDLRAIRRQLAEIGLDWDLPAYPPLAEATEIKPLKVTADLGELGKLVPKEESP